MLMRFIIDFIEPNVTFTPLFNGDGEYAGHVDIQWSPQAEEQLEAFVAAEKYP